MKVRRQVKVHHTTYTIEGLSSMVHVKLSRFTPPRGSKPADHGEFYVPESVIIEYAVARIVPHLARLLVQLGTKVDDPDGDAYADDEPSGGPHHG